MFGLGLFVEYLYYYVRWCASPLLNLPELGHHMFGRRIPLTIGYRPGWEKEICRWHLDVNDEVCSS
jgi:hypothetical protein